jgi:hypothetical protein
VFEALPEAGGIKRTGLAQTMERLFSSGKIKVEANVPPSKQSMSPLSWYLAA